MNKIAEISIIFIPYILLVSSTEGCSDTYGADYDTDRAHDNAGNRKRRRPGSAAPRTLGSLFDAERRVLRLLRGFQRTPNCGLKLSARCRALRELDDVGRLHVVERAHPGLEPLVYQLALYGPKHMKDVLPGRRGDEVRLVLPGRSVYWIELHQASCPGRNVGDLDLHGLLQPGYSREQLLVVAVAAFCIRSVLRLHHHCIVRGFRDLNHCNRFH